MSAEVKQYYMYKSLFHLAFVLLKDMNFMEAIRYGLSNLISSRWKKDREKQWKAIYPMNTCLFTYRHHLSSCVIRIVQERIKFGPFEEEQNDQVSSLQKRKGIAANLYRPFYQLKLAMLKAVVDQWIRWKTFGKSAFILFGSLRLRFSIVISSTELIYRIKVLPD